MTSMLSALSFRRARAALLMLVAAGAAVSTAGSASATDKPAAKPDAKPAAAAKKSRAELQRLLLTRVADAAELDAKLADGRAAGATPQQLLEARLFHAVLGGICKDFSALAAEARAAFPGWSKNDALIPLFLNPAKRNAFANTVSARGALAKKDYAAFRELAFDALWNETLLLSIISNLAADAGDAVRVPNAGADAALDKALEGTDAEAVRAAYAAALWDAPSRAGLFAKKVGAWRGANVTVPLDVEFKRVGGQPVTLAGLLRERGAKAVLLDFHASWCAPCMAAMPRLPEEARKLAPSGIVTVAFNVQNEQDAEAVQKRFKLELPVLVQEDRLYSELLGVNSIPRYVLLSKTGKVLFNGHPNDHEKLTAAVAKVK